MVKEVSFGKAEVEGEGEVPMQDVSEDFGFDLSGVSSSSGRRLKGMEDKYERIKKSSAMSEFANPPTLRQFITTSTKLEAKRNLEYGLSQPSNDDFKGLHKRLNDTFAALDGPTEENASLGEDGSSGSSSSSSSSGSGSGWRMSNDFEDSDMARPASQSNSNVSGRVGDSRNSSWGRAGGGGGGRGRGARGRGSGPNINRTSKPVPKHLKDTSKYTHFSLDTVPNSCMSDDKANTNIAMAFLRTLPGFGEDVEQVETTDGSGVRTAVPAQIGRPTFRQRSSKLKQGRREAAREGASEAEGNQPTAASPDTSAAKKSKKGRNKKKQMTLSHLGAEDEDEGM